MKYVLVKRWVLDHSGTEDECAKRHVEHKANGVESLILDDPSGLIGPKNIALWSEGCAATLGPPVRFWGVYQGYTLRDAVQRAYDEASQIDQRLFDMEKLTYWGCRFFDNEADARKAFG